MLAISVASVFTLIYLLMTVSVPNAVANLAPAAWPFSAGLEQVIQAPRLLVYCSLRFVPLLNVNGYGNDEITQIWPVDPNGSVWQRNWYTLASCVVRHLPRSS
jgi:hypothetical protein